MPPQQCQSDLTEESWKIRKSVLFSEAAAQFLGPQNPLLTLQGDDLTHALQRLKVATVHEICVSLGVGWALFCDPEHFSNLLPGSFLLPPQMYYYNNTDRDPLTAYQVMHYLSNSRHQSAHYHTLPEGEGDIDTFLHQYDAMINNIMRPYFQEFQVQQQVLYVWENNLWYLFPKIIGNQVDIGLRLEECYPNLNDIINDLSRLKEENKSLDQQVTDMSETEQKLTQQIIELEQAALQKDDLILSLTQRQPTRHHVQDGQPVEPHDTAIEAAAAYTGVTTDQPEQGSENELTAVKPTDRVEKNTTTKKKKKKKKKGKRNKRNK